MTNDIAARHARTKKAHSQSSSPASSAIKKPTPAASGVLADVQARQAQEAEVLQSPVSVTADEADQVLAEIKQEWSAQKMHALLSECRHQVLMSIVTPFGLGKIFSAYDKEGGNVTTVHNAKQKIYAKEEQQYNRNDYTGPQTEYIQKRNKYRKLFIEEDYEKKIHYCYFWQGNNNIWFLLH